MNENQAIPERLMRRIFEYYQLRKQKWPNVDEAMQWVETECAEVYELLLARKGGWVRNNPASKPEFSKEALAEELGDAIMMLLVAGYVEEADPLEALLEKMDRKLSEVVAGMSGRDSAIGGARPRRALRAGQPRKLWDVASPQNFCVHDVPFAQECAFCEDARETMYVQKEEKWLRS